MRQALISSESIDRLCNLKQQELNLKKQIAHVRSNNSKSIKEFSKLIDRLSEIQLQKEKLIRSM